MKDKTKLFVYGTLKFGGRLHPHLSSIKAPFLGENKLTGFKMFNMGWYPALQKTDDPNDVIVGEQYEIPLSELHNRFDQVEGYPHLYNRVETELGWVYYMSGDKATKGTLIKDGNFNVLD